MKLVFTLTFFQLLVSNIFGQTEIDEILISHLTGDFYIYTTAKNFNDDPPVSIPANGMYVVTNDGVILIDCPFDTTQFQPLLDSILARHNKKVVMCIATHSHDDRSAGLQYYRNKGIKTYTTKLTDDMSINRNEKRAEFLIYNDTTFSFGKSQFQIYYPGKGHTVDNIVIWFATEKVLYGGCLVKSTDATDLGNLKDAYVSDWAESIKNIQVHCKSPEFVIPGHFSWTNSNSLEHTLKLVDEYEKEKLGLFKKINLPVCVAYDHNEQVSFGAVYHVDSVDGELQDVYETNENYEKDSTLLLTKDFVRGHLLPDDKFIYTLNDKTPDTLNAESIDNYLNSEFYAIGQVLATDKFYGVIYERIFSESEIPSSEKFFCTFSKSGKFISRILIASFIFSGTGMSGSGARVPYFPDEHGCIEKDWTISFSSNDRGDRRYRIEGDGKIR